MKRETGISLWSMYLLKFVRNVVKKLILQRLPMNYYDLQKMSLSLKNLLKFQFLSLLKVVSVGDQRRITECLRLTPKGFAAPFFVEIYSHCRNSCIIDP